MLSDRKKTERPKTGIVIPCFNEELRLSGDSILSFLEKSPDIHFCLVNDGSYDDTANLIEQIAAKHDHISTVHLSRNMGKAEAVRRGILNLCEDKTFGFVGYWDADEATSFDEIHDFLGVFLNNEDLKIVLGSRIRRLGADIQRKWYRHYLGRVFATISSIMLKMPVYDTQCGAKMFKAELAEELFRNPFLTKWIFDVEILARAAGFLKEGICKSVYEHPLKKWEDKAFSHLRLNHYILAPKELYKIYKTYK
ncbi:glycosyltransferase [Desulforegula conservatrix]|uniref:glycosyltransferase n=1 Tax=Desulforegula conservatrix TaxID=153026 RepID=UPI000405DF6E|nr:glycosyltransferase [Desulforegula conservatrix]